MRRLSLRDALREAMTEEMRRDKDVFLMGEEVAEYDGAYKVSKGMLQEFGEKRVIDTPISELGFAAIGVGAAMNGLRPIVEFMTWNFSILAWDQIVNHAAKILSMSGGQCNCPIVFRGPTGSAGQLAQQHSQTFESWLSNCPGIKVISTIDPLESKALLKAAIRDNDPVCFMESELMYTLEMYQNENGERVYEWMDNAGTVGQKKIVRADGDINETEDYVLPIGKAAIRRAGTDVTIVSYNKMILVALEAAEILAAEGISAEVIDLRTIRPMDYDTLVESVKKTNRMIVVEEAWPFASVATEISYMMQKRAFDYLDAPILRLTGADVAMCYAPTLVEEFLPSVEEVVEAAKKVLYENA